MSAFTEAVEHGLRGLKFVSTGLLGSCPDCQAAHGMEPREFFAAVANGDECDEGSFSWQQCDCCRSDLGGMRYAAHGLAEDNDALVHLDVCTDCAMYISNGDEPEQWEG